MSALPPSITSAGSASAAGDVGIDPYRLNHSRVTVIRPRRGKLLPDIAELWRYRDLLWQYVLRDIQVRYKQSMLGASWAVVRPVASMVVFQIFFGQLMGLQKQVDGVAYAVFVFAGLLPWQFFAEVVRGVSLSMIANAHILKKVYVPRLILPLSVIGAPLLDFACAFLVLAGLMWHFQVVPTANLALVPLLLLSVIVVSLGVGLVLASLAVWWRDFAHTVPFMLQIWFFLTPVIYPVSLVQNPHYRWMLSLNPMVGTMDAFRAAILGQPIQVETLAVSLAVGVGLLVTGLMVFNLSERHFEDVV
ncbi:MAG: ABC transporter permease [Phycisphaeraceae bacterium]|nr:ABC transporter permease [Phycisphaeraceae bacterium]